VLQVGVACVRLDGSMSLEQRDTVIKTFTNDPKVSSGCCQGHHVCQGL
jgi:hypothetical protein